jgi:hypothetical protein
MDDAFAHSKALEDRTQMDSKQKIDHLVSVHSTDVLFDSATIADAFIQCAEWIDGKLENGEVVPPATLRFTDANGNCFCKAELDCKNCDWDGQMEDFEAKEDFESPFFAVLEDSQSNRFVVRMELDCARPS